MKKLFSSRKPVFAPFLDERILRFLHSRQTIALHILLSSHSSLQQMGKTDMWNASETALIS